jgi:hypothetical protein
VTVIFRLMTEVEEWQWSALMGIKACPYALPSCHALSV